MLHFVYIDEIDAQLQDIELIVEAEFHDAGGGIDISRCIEVLPGQVEEVVTADLQLEVLDVVVDDLRAYRAKLVHRVLLVLLLNRHGSILDHEAEVIQRNPNDEHGHVVAD